MVIAAHSLSRRGTAVFCHLTALELHRLPLPHVPRALHVRASSRGRAGTSGPASAYVNEERTRQAADQLSRDPGHRHLSGPLPALPAVRRHGNLLGLGPGLDRAVRVPVLLSDGTWMAEVFVDPLPVTLAIAFSQEPVTVTAPAADALARRGAVLDSLAVLARTLLSGREALRRFDETLRFADGRSESAGESLSRALIHELGFAVPELQVELRSPSGEFLGRPEFWWRQVRLIGEFDGMTKYTRVAREQGRTAEEVLVAERRRELRLTGPDRRMIRWMGKDLMDEAGFERLLLEAGVPRR